MKLWFKIIVFESSLVAQMVKSLPIMQETWIQSLGQEDLEKGIATHFSILAGQSHGWRSLAGPNSWHCKESDTTKQLTHTRVPKATLIFGFPSSSSSKEHPPAVQKTQVRSLDWEDLLEKEMATHSSILAQRISWTEEPCGLQSMRLQRVGHNSRTNTHTQ